MSPRQPMPCLKPIHINQADSIGVPIRVSHRLMCSGHYSSTPVICTSVIQNLDYPNAVLNVDSVKKNGIPTKIADSATEQSACVCVSYVHVQCRHTVVHHRVQCEV